MRSSLSPLMPGLLPAVLAACTATQPAGTATPDDSGTEGQTATDPGTPVFAFSYALIADPHITTPTGDHNDRLQLAVDWVNDQAADRSIALTFVLGDIAWDDGFDASIGSLEGLSMPWLPVLGDNPIQSNDEVAWADAFADHIALLSTSLDGWTRAPDLVDNPVEGGQSRLQSYAFDYGGLRFVTLDWNSRELGTIWGETPDLHDFTDGTLPFLQSQLDDAGEGLAERMILLSHMAMISGPGSFDLKESAALEGTLGPYADLVYGNHSGHLHGNGEDEWPACGLHVDTTDATWDDEVTVRLVQVWQDKATVSYQDELFELQ